MVVNETRMTQAYNRWKNDTVAVAGGEAPVQAMDSATAAGPTLLPPPSTTATAALQNDGQSTEAPGQSAVFSTTVPERVEQHPESPYHLNIPPSDQSLDEFNRNNNNNNNRNSNSPLTSSNFDDTVTKHVTESALDWYCRTQKAKRAKLLNGHKSMEAPSQPEHGMEFFQLHIRRHAQLQHIETQQLRALPLDQTPLQPWIVQALPSASNWKSSRPHYVASLWGALLSGHWLKNSDALPPEQDNQEGHQSSVLWLDSTLELSWLEFCSLLNSTLKSNSDSRGKSDWQDRLFYHPLADDNVFGLLLGWLYEQQERLESAAQSNNQRGQSLKKNILIVWDAQETKGAVETATAVLSAWREQDIWKGGTALDVEANIVIAFVVLSSSSAVTGFKNRTKHIIALEAVLDGVGANHSYTATLENQKIPWM